MMQEYPRQGLKERVAQEYFDRLPSKEQALIRDLLATRALREALNFIGDSDDPRTVKLGNILNPPLSRFTPQITDFAEGPGTFSPTHECAVGDGPSELMEGQVVCVVDSTRCMCGTVEKFVFQRQPNGTLEFVTGKVLAWS